MKLAILIQARLGSSRLPGKVLLPLLGEPVLFRMLERVLAKTVTGEVLVITTTEPEDRAIVQACEDRNVPVFCGHPTDVLDRHYQAAKAQNADIVVKIPSDCPLIDPKVIDAVITRFLSADGRYDFVTNLLPATHPDGNDVEVMSFRALETAWKEAVRPLEREHTTPFIWENPERFSILNVPWETGLDYSKTHRFVLDYPEDYEFIVKVFEQLLPSHGPLFSLENILALLEEAPGLFEINRKRLGTSWQSKHASELRTYSQGNARIVQVV